MRCIRPALETTFLTLFSLTALWAGREGVPLNDYTRLGQRFTATQAFYGLWVVVPSWLDAEGGLTLTLWDSPQRTKRLAQKEFTNIADNARVSLFLPKALPRGVYYWEVNERTGQTQVGLYGDTLESETEDCAYFDGVPDRKRRFSFGITPAAFPSTDTSELIAALKSAATVEDRMEVCRQLAVVGKSEAVRALTDLLEDEQFSHMARYALEPMPYSAVDAALRGALKKAKGPALVGIINSIGKRRDPGAVGSLDRLLHDPHPEIASASAIALGKIATRAAANALERAMGSAPAGVRPAVYEGSLDCAGKLTAQGQRHKTIAIYDKLCTPERPIAVRAAAMRGAIVTRGEGGLSLLIAQLHGIDPGTVNVALWVIQHELPGVKVTEALAAELSKLPSERQLLLIQALGNRGDRAALPALLAVARSGDRPVRLAALRVLPNIGDASVVPALVMMLVESDAEVSQAARESLAALPGREVGAAVASLLDSSEDRSQLAGIELALRQMLVQTVPTLIRVSREASPQVRLAALKALGELASGDDLSSLADLLINAREPQEIETAERSLSSICPKAGDSAAAAKKLAPRLAQAQPAQKAALLRVLASVGGAEALQTMRDEAGDADPEVRRTALQLLSEWKTADAAPDLLQLARTATSSADRLRSLRGYLRIAGNQDVPVGQRLSLCEEATPLVERDEEKKLLLAALGGIAAPQALALVLPHLDDAATTEEAGLAAVAIAEKLVGGPDAPKVVEAMEKVAQATGNPDLAKRAQALLKEAQAKGAGK